MGACACTGVRWCAVCRDPDVRAARRMDDVVEIPAFLEPPPPCGEEHAPGEGPIQAFDPASHSAPGCPEFAGVLLLEDFIDPAEADALLAVIERRPFKPAQSGKGKQHFGAKVNFNKRKVNLAGFAGLPEWAHGLVRRIECRLEALGAQDDLQPGLEQAWQTFTPTDVFVLRYERGSASNLDFHVDDTFAYGELIAALSLESDSVMTFLPGTDEMSPADASYCVRVPLPARSLALVYGPARYDWQHAILADDIAGRRTSVTIRCLSEVLSQTETGRALVEQAGCSLPIDD